MPTVEVSLPVLHTGQIDIFMSGEKYNVVRCGRRWGKTKQMVTMAADAAAKGRKVGLFTPEHKQLNEPYREILWLLRDIKDQASKTEGVIRTINGGLVDFWSLNDNELAGRGREYDLVMIDEAAFTKDTQMLDIWRKSIGPTMLTKPGAKAWVFSTPRGINPDNFFWKICHNQGSDDGIPTFKEHYAPTSNNPFVSPDELERERLTNHPRVFDQEFKALFVDWSGDALFLEEWLLENGKPAAYPTMCDWVFAVMDTAVKTGSANDGTGVSFWSVGVQTSTANDGTRHYFGHPLICLDWDIVQIEGATLELWMPKIFKRLEDLALQCKARGGSRGAFIEDAQSGSILLQQCRNKGLPAQPLPQILTAAGKDGRALNISGAVSMGKVKWSRHAFEKVVTYKGTSRNHMLEQVKGFHIGDKDAGRRADDLFDTFTYAIAIALGNKKGIA